MEELEWLLKEIETKQFEYLYFYDLDPEGILGDPIYDLLFGIVSNIDIIKNIDVDLIFNMIGLTKYHYSLLLIVLFNRIKRSKKYHPEDTLEYIKIFDELKVKYETLFSDNI